MEDIIKRRSTIKHTEKIFRRITTLNLIMDEELREYQNSFRKLCSRHYQGLLMEVI